ncbi:MAG: hypothetical protein J6T13_06270 [Bacteroidales bacterium]|nr:hypothetical protein [Bacteroidales bacterium]
MTKHKDTGCKTPSQSEAIIIGRGGVTPTGFNADAACKAMSDWAQARQRGLLAGVDLDHLIKVDDTHLRNSFEALVEFGSDGYTRTEMALIVAANQAIEEANIAPFRDNVVFIVSDDTPHLDEVAQTVVEFFDNPNTPILMSDTHIHDHSANAEAERMLTDGKYKYIVVVYSNIGSESKVNVQDKKQAEHSEADQTQPLQLAEVATAAVMTLEHSDEDILPEPVF